MEIKHGRLSMAAFLGVITTYSGLRWPGYLSTSENIKFEDIPGGAISSWAVRARPYTPPTHVHPSSARLPASQPTPQRARSPTRQPR